MTRSYCTACVAGQGACRHRSERLWYQYHHWTPERLGVDGPPTLDSCSWATSDSEKTLVCDVRQNIYEQQSVKLAKTLEAQKEKNERGVKRDCTETEGDSCDYQVHLSTLKQNHKGGRFTHARASKLFSLLRQQSKK